MSQEQNTDTLLEKLNVLNDVNIIDWNTWSNDEKIKLLQVYLQLVKREGDIYDLIWNNHDCDSWEYLFCDYNITELAEKKQGVEIAIETLIGNEFDCDSSNDTGTDDENEIEHNIIYE